MKGFIEIKEDSYEDTVEYVHKIKSLACKLMKMLSEHIESDEYDEDYETKSRRKNKSRYDY